MPGPRPIRLAAALKVVAAEINVTADTIKVRISAAAPTMQNHDMARQPANRITAAALAAKYRGKRELFT